MSGIKITAHRLGDIILHFRDPQLQSSAERHREKPKRKLHCERHDSETNFSELALRRVRLALNEARRAR